MSQKESIPPVRVPLCFNCRHFDNSVVGKFTCAAFKEIPVEILLGRILHFEPLESQLQDTIVYDPIDIIKKEKPTV